MCSWESRPFGLASSGWWPLVDLRLGSRDSCWWAYGHSARLLWAVGLLWDVKFVIAVEKPRILRPMIRLDEVLVRPQALLLFPRLLHAGLSAPRCLHLGRMGWNRAVCSCLPVGRLSLLPADGILCQWSPAASCVDLEVGRVGEEKEGFLRRVPGPDPPLRHVRV